MIHSVQRASVVVLSCSIMTAASGWQFHTGVRHYRQLTLDPPEPLAAEAMKLGEAALQVQDSGDVSAFQELMHSEVRDTADPAAIAGLLSFIHQQAGTISDIAPVEAMEVEFPKSSPRDPNGLFRCPPLPSEKLGSKVLVSSPTLGTAVILLSKGTSENGNHPIWLSIVAKPEDDTLRLTGFHFSFQQSGGHGPKWFAQKASDFQAAGQLRNAYLFREAAINLAPSPYLTPFYFQDLRREQPTEPPEGLPRPGLRTAESWVLPNGQTFHVDYVASVTATGFFGLEVRYMSDDDDPTSVAASVARRELFDYFRSKYPEYADAFEGVFVGTETRSGRGFRDYFAFDAHGTSGGA